jgi:hypothetical protein
MIVKLSDQYSLGMRELLVHPTAFAQQPQRGLEAMDDVASLPVVEALVVLALSSSCTTDAAALAVTRRVDPFLNVIVGG